MGYPSYPAQYTLMTKLSMTPSLFQTCVEEVENAEYAAPQEPLLSMRGEVPLDEELDP